ncbi:hypothetical protein DBR11_11450 [Pedobacter sp. HMWF019]|uniref:hypothetical protein n=1 Tax=Pedobacter sp. HMWF019 TaxID=2056856 RepID=UPI000D358894|nr:hypothetical protein [Pedobacter sp. HMWF019]PTS99881.1 hypothetical protein DBR11_11450 [Pedobacter sp. HMWF019]
MGDELEIVLVTDVFKHDKQNRQFVDTKNASNVVEYDAFRGIERASMVTLNYHTGIRNHYSGMDPKILDFGQQVKVNIPILALEGSTTDQRILESYNERAADQKMKFHFITEQDRKRFKGELPTVKIENTEFEINLESKNPYLRSLAETKDILLKNCNLDSGESGHRFAFDTKTQTLAKLDLNTITEIPSHIVFVKIGDEFELDPVGVARRSEHFPDTEYLANHPYKARHVAERIPCPKQVMDKIQENRKREGLPPLINKRPIKLKV